MPLPILAGVVLLGALAGLTGGCAARHPESETPKEPSGAPGAEALAKAPREVSDPCPSDREIPVERGAFFSGASRPLDVHGDLKALRRLNPRFLCGLERITVYPFTDALGNPCEIESKKVRGCYDPPRKMIYIDEVDYDSHVLFHEVGHHLERSAGRYLHLDWNNYFSEFLAFSWRHDRAQGTLKPRKAHGDLLFATAYATVSPREDFAETFAAAVAQRLKTEGYIPRSDISGSEPEPLQQKIRHVSQLFRPDPLDIGN